MHSLFSKKHNLARNARHLADSAGVLLKNNVNSEKIVGYAGGIHGYSTPSTNRYLRAHYTDYDGGHHRDGSLIVALGTIHSLNERANNLSGLVKLHVSQFKKALHPSTQ
jgi:hypothetical protein